ncbi:MAG: DNA polymerase III subunit delta [Pseudomonadota bacterium]
MSAYKASDVARKLNALEKLPPIIAVFGPDRGLVTETAQKLAGLFDGADDPFAVVKLDAATVTGETGRLVDEARTVSLFGAKRLVWVRDAAGRNLAPAVQPLLDDPPTDAIVLLEAGDLKRGVGLRKAVEASPVAAGIYCPPDTHRDLERMIEEEARSLGLNVDPEARSALVERIGADRGASRGEVSKACLYAAGTGRLTLADVDAVVGDVSLTQMSEAVDAAFLGDRAHLSRMLGQVLRQDSHAAQLLMNAQWALQAYEPAAAAIAGGASPTRAVDAVRPPLYGARKKAASEILARWSPEALRAASQGVAQALFRTRVMPALAIPVARDFLLRVASHRSERTRAARR